MKKLVLIAAILAIAGGTGWFFYNQNKDSAQNGSQTNNNQSTANDPSEDGKYLVIKEWGVRAKLLDELQDDISYVVEEDTDHGISIVLRSQKVDLDNCAPISMIRNEREGFGDIKIGNYYYGIRKGVLACDVLDSPAQQEAAAVQEKLSEALRTLEASND